MKTVKILVISITLFVVAFLSIGFIIRETKYVTEVKIEKPLEDVFSTFNDSSKLKNWIPEFKSIETIEEKKEKKGSRYKITLENNGQELFMEEKILEFIPNKKVSLFYNTGAGNMLKTASYTFTTEGNMTIVSHKATCRSSGYLMACMLPIFKSKLKNQDQAYLDSFKIFLEKQ